MGYFKEKGVDVACCPWMNFNTMKPMADYIYTADGKVSVPWRRLGKAGARCKGNFYAMPRTDGRFVLLTERSAKKASVWDFADAENPKLLREYLLSGNPDAGAFFEGRAIVPAGHQGLLLERQ